MCVGDGEGDRTAGEVFGCKFIGLATSLNGWSPDTAPFRVLGSLVELESL